MGGVCHDLKAMGWRIVSVMGSFFFFFSRIPYSIVAPSVRGRVVASLF